LMDTDTIRLRLLAIPLLAQNDAVIQAAKKGNSDGNSRKVELLSREDQ